mmetsp:Transcript_37333/g.90655  ORF Transcript_37333/g.90655 Transcript_37333/m.90655 type:complete len:218 (+) Transcript_37333:799-1452(+)
MAAWRMSKTARHPSMAASRTRSNVSKSGKRDSHCDRTMVPRCGSIAHGRWTAGCPPFEDSSLRLRSTSVVSVVPPAYPAEQEHSKSFMGIPPSTSAREAALMDAHNRPPSSARMTTLTSIRDFGYKCSKTVASKARLSMCEISISLRSVFGLVTRRSPDGAKGVAFMLTSIMARSGSSSERRTQAMGPLTVARTTVRPISTRALPPTDLAVEVMGPI